MIIFVWSRKINFRKFFANIIGIQASKITFLHGFARTAFRLVTLQFGYYRLRYFFFKVIVPKRKCSRCTKDIKEKKDALDDKIVWYAGKLGWRQNWSRKKCHQIFWFKLKLEFVRLSYQFGFRYFIPYNTY